MRSEMAPATLSCRVFGWSRDIVCWTWDIAPMDVKPCMDFNAWARNSAASGENPGACTVFESSRLKKVFGSLTLALYPKFSTARRAAGDRGAVAKP
jgi:hypothetical protein